MHGIITPTQRAAIERRQRFCASIATKASLVRPKPCNVVEIPNTPYGVPKVQPATVIVKRVILPMEYYHQEMWFYDLVTYVGDSRAFKSRPSIADVQLGVCNQFNVHLIDLLSTRRTADVVGPRQISMFLSKKMTLRSLPEVGRRHGGRDHTTVLHAVKKIARKIEKDEALAAVLSELETKIRSGL